MTLKIHALLVLLGLCAGAWGQAVNLTCTKQIVESYGIISHDQAKKERLVMCPNIQFTCCPAYEQFKMFKTFSENVKPAFILLNEVIKKELKLLRDAVVGLVSSGTIDQRIGGISDKAAKLRAQFTWNKIRGKRPAAIFDKLFKYQKISSSYVAAWKSAFYCTICDFANQNFIDVPNKRITYSAASCDALAQNTLLFTNLLNNVLIPYLSGLTEIIVRIKGNSKYQKLHNIRAVNKAINDCVADYKQYDSGLGNCKAYCQFFNPATDNYVFEGYPEFFANTLVEIRLFGGGGGGSSAGGSGSPAPAPPAGGNPAPPSRRLIEKSVQALIRKTRERNRRLNQKIENDYYFEPRIPKMAKFRGFNHRRILEEDRELEQLEQIQEEQFKLENRRILADTNDWSQDNLDPNNNVTQIIDIFDVNSSDREFDDAMVNQMMQVQDIFNTGDPATFAQLIRKYYVDNFSADLDDIDSDNLFKQTSINRTDISEYKTIFSFAGIDIHRIVAKLNWSLAIKQIGVSLTSSSNDDSEMVFPDVILAINTVSNRDVRDFYRDQYFNFRKPQFNLFNETMTTMLRNFAMTKLRRIIAENMAVYNYLVQNMNQENADNIWTQIEGIRMQVKGLAMNNNNYTVVLYNQTIDGKVVESLNITGPANSSGYANVTTIQNVQSLSNDYKTVAALVNQNQKDGYNDYVANLKQKNAQGSQGGGPSRKRQRRALMASNKKQKLKK